MTNVEYIIAAYAITLGALALYGLSLWRGLRSVEREIAVLTADQRMLDGGQ